MVPAGVVLPRERRLCLGLDALERVLLPAACQLELAHERVEVVLGERIGVQLLQHLLHGLLGAHGPIPERRGQEGPQRGHEVHAHRQRGAVVLARAQHVGVELLQQARVLVGRGHLPEPRREARPEVVLPEGLATAAHERRRLDTPQRQLQRHEAPHLLRPNFARDDVALRNGVRRARAPLHPERLVLPFAGHVVDVVVRDEEGHEVRVVKHQVKPLVEGHGGGVRAH